MDGASSEELAGTQLETLVELMPDVAVVIDASGIVLSTNDRVDEVFGYKPDELVGERVEVLIPERLRHVHRLHRQGFVEEPRARRMGLGLDLFGRRSDGTEFPVDVSLAPVETGRGLRVLAAIRDVSERKSAEATRAQLASIVQSSLDAIISMSVQGSITSWNPGAETLFDYTADEAIGGHVSMLVPHGRSEELETVLDGAMSGSPGAPLDTRWLRQDGAEVDVAISVSPVRSADGELIGFAALVRDITERKQAEAALHRLLAEEQRRERWQTAMADIRLTMLAGTAIDEVLQRLCTLALEVLGADLVVLAISEGEDLAVASAAGETSLSRARLIATPLVKRAVAGKSIEVTAGGPGSVDLGPDLVRHALCAPFGADSATTGALLVIRPEDGTPIDSIDLQTAEAFAEQAAVALQLGQAREDQERLMLVADRERIARDLHDLVIQRLFAVGMALQAASRLIGDDEAVGRVAAAVEDLDATIAEIRTVIFELEPPPTARGGLRAEVLGLAGRARDGLGFEPTVRFDGPIDSSVPPRVIPHLLAALQEGLSNVARHARASHAEVDLAVGEEIRLVVADDGTGIGDLSRMSGLANLRERARALGGLLELGDRPGGGTRLVWRVPR